MTRAEGAKRLLRDEGPWALLAMGLTSLVAIWVLKLWDATAHIPFSYHTDALFNAAEAKGLMDNAWYYENDELAAPLGQQQYDFPALADDTLHLLGIKALGFVFSSPFTVMNLYFLASFPLCALTGYAALRWIGLNKGPSVLGATLFALLPYHFLKGEVHLFLAAYYVVPLGGALVIGVLGGRTLFGRRADRRGPRAWITPTTLATVAVCVIVSMGSIYYAAFTAILAGFGAVVMVVVHKRPKQALTGLAVVAIIGTAMFVQLTPSLAYGLKHGTNETSVKRDPAESEFFGMKLVQLVMPVHDHRIKWLGDKAGHHIVKTRILGEPVGSLGIIGTIGLAWLLLVALAGAVSNGGRSIASALEGQAATAAVMAFLVATVGGLSAVLAYMVAPELRTWSRMSVFMGFFSLLAAMLLLERLRPRVGGRPLAFGAVLTLVGVLGVLDQTTAKMSADYPAIKKQYESDAGFVHMMERELPPRAEVFQLPYVEFPEAGFIHKMMDYEHLKPYLHSTRLRFSYGAVKGRETDWSEEAVRGPLETTVRRVAAAGFEAIQIDRFGYGNNAFTFEQALADIIGVGGRTSADERLAFFDLRPYAEDLRAELGDATFSALGESTTHPIEEIWAGAYDLESDADSYWRWAPERATLSLENPDSGPREVVVSAELHRVDETPRTVTVTWPDGSTEPFTLAKAPQRLSRTLTLPPGKSTLEFATDGEPNPSPEGEDRRVAIRNLIVVPPAACGDRVDACGDGPRPQLP